MSIFIFSMYSIFLLPQVMADEPEHVHGAPIDLAEHESLGYFFGRLFEADFMPHGHCYFWKPEIVWLHVISDGLIAAAYFAIPIMLFFFVKKRADIPFHWVFGLFAAFIFWCGTTHVLNIWTLWEPVYRLDGVVKAITAGVSVLTAVVLFPLIPKLLALRSPKELEILNRTLAEEILTRKNAEKGLESANEVLERKVRDRTAQLDEKQRQLERSNSDLEQFAYVASHDLQEPLRMISSYCQLLKEEQGEQLGEDSQQYINFAVDGAQRMKGLIDELLEFSQIGRRDDDLVESFDARVAVDLALENLKPQVDESNATISVGSLPRIRANKALVVSLFQNLIQNAIKYSKSGERPIVAISAKPMGDGDQSEFIVEDKGIGIEREQLERVFVIFQRLHSRTEYPGSGMGLAICKKIVETLHGRIWAESEPGQGSSFHFTLLSDTKHNGGDSA